MIIYSAVLILAFIILAVIVSLFIGGFGAISLLTLLAAYCITLLPIFMVCSFALAVSTFVRTSTASFVVCLLGYIGISALGLYFSSLAVALPTNYMTIYKMILGSRIPWSNLATGSLILIGYTIVFASIANMRFAKKEV